MARCFSFQEDILNRAVLTVSSFLAGTRLLEPLMVLLTVDTLEISGFLPPPFPYVSMQELEVPTVPQYPCYYLEDESEPCHLSCFVLPQHRPLRCECPRPVFSPTAPPWLHNHSLFEAVMLYRPWFQKELPYEELGFKESGPKEEFNDVYHRNLKIFETVDSAGVLPSKEELVKTSASENLFGYDERATRDTNLMRPRMTTSTRIEELRWLPNLRGKCSDELRPRKRQALENFDENGIPIDMSVFTSYHDGFLLISIELGSKTMAGPGAGVLEKSIQPSTTPLPGSFHNPIDLTHSDSNIDDTRVRGPEGQSTAQQKCLYNFQPIFSHPHLLSLPIYSAKLQWILAWLDKLERPDEPILLWPQLPPQVESQRLYSQLQPSTTFLSFCLFCSSRPNTTTR